MSILSKDYSNQYLIDWKDGKIKQGLSLGIPKMDEHFRYKKAEFTIINGIDNTGKTIWFMWYLLALSVKYNLKWVIWSGENSPNQLVRQLIQFWKGKYVANMDHSEILACSVQIREWFHFVDHTGFYKLEELFDVFSSVECAGGLIDPFTGLDRGFSHSDNYDFLNKSRAFVNKTGRSLFVNTHPNTEAARRRYPSDHDLAFYVQPPQKSDSEGGQPFANRPDNFLTIHRFVGHEMYNYETLLYVRKIKDTETGGRPTAIDEAIAFDWNKGLGFTSEGINPINSTQVSSYFNLQEKSNDFDDEIF